jgi:hypothetical protein
VSQKFAEIRGSADISADPEVNATEAATQVLIHCTPGR